MRTKIDRTRVATCIALALSAACTPPDADRTDSPAGRADSPGVAIDSGAAIDPAAPARSLPVEHTPYRAAGTEPFWGLDITSGGLRFSTPENIDGTRFPPAAPLTAGDTLTWRSEIGGATIEASIWPERCSDGMSDRTWTYGAAVAVDTVRYRGCADPAPGLPRALRPLGAWLIAGHRIPGVSAVPDEEAARLQGRTIVFDSARAISDARPNPDAGAVSDADVCSDAAYRYLTVAADSMLAELGTTPAAAGLEGTPGGFIGVTEVRCNDVRWSAPGGLLLWANEDQPLTVWDGVLYELTLRQ